MTFTLSTFLGVLSQIKNGKSRCRKLVFVWCIRETSEFHLLISVVARPEVNNHA